MVRIYNTAGSTQFLLDEIRKTFPNVSTLHEIEFLYNNYTENLENVERDIWSCYNPKLTMYDREIMQIKSSIEEESNKYSNIFSAEIGRLQLRYTDWRRKQVSNRPTFSQRLQHLSLAFHLFYLKATYQRRIIGKTQFDRRMLKETGKKRCRLESNIIILIDQEKRKHLRVHAYITANESFLIGARGEEAVITELQKLPESYYLFNDVRFNAEERWIYDHEERFKKSCQIDHIVVGPTGIFLLETKNWSEQTFDERYGDPHGQIYRAGRIAHHCFFQYLRLKIEPKNVVVTVQPRKRIMYDSVDQTTVSHLDSYIIDRDQCLRRRAIGKIAEKLRLFDLKNTGIQKETTPSSTNQYRTNKILAISNLT